MNNLNNCGCDVSVIVPVYNERKALPGFIEKLKSAAGSLRERTEVIIVDDGSTDGTGKLLKGAEGVKVITHPENRGYGSALKTGISASSGEWALIIDADRTYRPEDMGVLLGQREGFDMVVGLRTGAGVYESPVKRPAKWFLRKLAGHVAGRDIPDLNSGLRLFKKDAALRFWSLYPKRFSFTATITMCFMCNDLRVRYVEVDYLRRIGKSKIVPKNFFQFINLVIRLAVYFDPMKVFLPLALAIFVAGVSVALYSFFIIGRLMNTTTVVLVLVSVQVFFFGILADLIARRSGS